VPHARIEVQEDRPLLGVGLGGREGAVGQNEVRLAFLDVLEAVTAGHHTPRTDMALWLLPVRVQPARLQALHQFGLRCDESDRHAIALATRFVGIEWGPEVRRGAGRCDPKIVLQVGCTETK
jgi:hypothetical protein